MFYFSYWQLGFSHSLYSLIPISTPFALSLCAFSGWFGCKFICIKYLNALMFFFSSFFMFFFIFAKRSDAVDWLEWVKIGSTQRKSVQNMHVEIINKHFTKYISINIYTHKHEIQQQQTQQTFTKYSTYSYRICSEISKWNKATTTTPQKLLHFQNFAQNCKSNAKIKQYTIQTTRIIL